MIKFFNKKIAIALLLSSSLQATVWAQSTAKVQAKTNTADTLNALDNKHITELPIISLDDNDFESSSGSQNVTSLLTAGRDAFYNAASYNFSAARYRIRGYDSEFFATYMNGLSMDNLDNGFTPFGLWSGLNDVTRNRDLSIGLRANTFAFGDIGSTTNIDLRASKQRKQTEIGYAFSNRAAVHRLDATYSSGINKKGWAYTFSGTRRYSNEGYIPGTFINSYSWFAGIDKQLGNKHLLSLVAFGAPTTSGRQTPVVQEAYHVTGSNFYNPYWGWQNGQKRNGYVNRNHQPVAILTHEFNPNNSTNLITSVGFMTGDRASSTIDWYNAYNPSPVYYRNLPSYYDDPKIATAIATEWATNDNVRQINWENLYAYNKNQYENFKGVTGNRSKFIQGEYVTNTTKFNVSSVINKRIFNKHEFTAGVNYQTQYNKNYKQLIDLLGGDYYVDYNQFAERAYPNNDGVKQSDINNPDKIVKVGDKYGYNYDVAIAKLGGFIQQVFKFKQVDIFMAGELSSTSYYRKGNFKNGLFANNSYGESPKYSFSNYAVKGGVTYKIDGRNYIYANAAMLNKAPYYDNVFVSLRTRNDVQKDIKDEQVQSFEAGYILNAPKIKARATGYLTNFKNQMNVLSFFHDGYQNFVNYGLTGINKQHMGIELGVDAKVAPNLTLNAAAGIGKFIYKDRMNATTILDNDAAILSQDTVYSKNYNLGGTPQQVYSLGFYYRSPKYWSVSVSYNYFASMWVDINPIRRTYNAIQSVPQYGTEWYKILNQEKLKAQSTVDLYATYSYKLPKQHQINNKSNYIVFSASISNMLNNTGIVQTAFEQLRYDFKTNDVDKFPTRYSYAFGLNYSFSIAYRF